MIDRILRFTLRVLQYLSACCYAAQGNATWRSRDGRVIPIRQMDDAHLRNTIRMVEREHLRTQRPFPPVYQFLIREQMRREAHLFGGHPDGK